MNLLFYGGRVIGCRGRVLLLTGGGGREESDKKKPLWPRRYLNR